MTDKQWLKQLAIRRAVAARISFQAQYNRERQQPQHDPYECEDRIGCTSCQEFWIDERIERAEFAGQSERERI